MPEGPSIVILKEELQPFKSKTVIKVEGNSKLDIQQLQGKKVLDFKSWGKHLLICFERITIRIHLMLFGSYRINEKRESLAPRLSLFFKNGEVNFYSCSVKFIEGDLDSFYDWEVDTMSDKWNPEKAFASLKDSPKALACDVLLDQNIFAGSGNIIKNEVLFRVKIHPLSIVGKIPRKKLKELVNETRKYCFDFYAWKKQYALRKHWQVYRKTVCPRCNIPIIRKPLGKNNRRSFFCNNCQMLYKAKELIIKNK